MPMIHPPATQAAMIRDKKGRWKKRARKARKRRRAAFRKAKPAVAALGAVYFSIQYLRQTVGAAVWHWLATGVGQW